MCQRRINAELSEEREETHAVPEVEVYLINGAVLGDLGGGVVEAVGGGGDRFLRTQVAPVLSHLETGRGALDLGDVERVDVRVCRVRSTSGNGEGLDASCARREVVSAKGRGARIRRRLTRGGLLESDDALGREDDSVG